MSKQLNPNRGYAILKPLEEHEQTYGRIIIPDVGETKSSQATIVRFSPTYNYNLGVEVECLFSVGDVVLYPAMGSQKQTLDGEDFIICAITDLLASITETDE